MSAQRKLIRHAMADALAAAAIPGVVKVHRTRVRPFWRTGLPAINIVASDESAEVADESPRTLERTLQVKVEIIGKQEEGLDDELDDLADAVEQVLLLEQNQTLGGKVADLIYTGSELVVKGEGEEAVAGLVLSYDATYYTEEVAPDPVDDFMRAHTETTLHGSTPTTPKAIDDVTLEQ